MPKAGGEWMAVDVFTWETIRGVVDSIDLKQAMSNAFQAYSAGMAVVPPVGEMCFEDPPGDVHIKYGYLKSGPHYVVKIASGFYNNPALGLSSSQGLMLLFCKQTGQLQAVLLDDGNLTDIRTGGAGALAANLLGSKGATALGMVGTGIQARHQLQQVARHTAVRKLWAWGRNKARLEEYLTWASALGFEAQAAPDLATLTASSNWIFTTTPAEAPLIQAQWVRPGTHITAVGSDTASKQELEGALLAKADRVVVDSLKQSRTRGEVYRAVQSGHLDPAGVLELGAVLREPSLGRTDEKQITIADLTGVAVQDLAIATAVVETLRES